MFWGFSGFSLLQEIFVCYWFLHSHTKHLLMFLYTCPLPSVYLGISWTSKEIWPFSASYITENIGKLELLKIVLFLFFLFLSFFLMAASMAEGSLCNRGWIWAAAGTYTVAAAATLDVAHPMHRAQNWPHTFGWLYPVQLNS